MGVRTEEDKVEEDDESIIDEVELIPVGFPSLELIADCKSVEGLNRRKHDSEMDELR